MHPRITSMRLFKSAISFIILLYLRTHRALCIFFFVISSRYSEILVYTDIADVQVHISISRKMYNPHFLFRLNDSKLSAYAQMHRHQTLYNIAVTRHLLTYSNWFPISLRSICPTLTITHRVNFWRSLGASLWKSRFQCHKSCQKPMARWERIHVY